MVSIVILVIIFLGTVQYFIVSRNELEKGTRSQMAWISVSSQLERAISLGYDSLQDSLPEVSTSIILNGIQGYRTTVVTPIDDPLDDDVPDYLKVAVYFSWFTPENITDSTVVYFTPQRSWDY